MKIGETIQRFRKAQGLTQEALAHRLGVTTSAVSKWERDISCPDIVLLKPLARALGITVDTLLSFRSDVTAEEITALVRQADKLFRTDAFHAGFLFVKTTIETYPNCLALIWQLAVILDAQRFTRDAPHAADYDDYILACYNRVLQSEDETLRTSAADSLFGYYLRSEDYALAESCLSYFSEQNPQRKLKQAILYSKTERKDDACRALEELLFSGCQQMNLTLQHLALLAMEDRDLDRVQLLTDKQQTLAKAFDMGSYHEACCKLELATVEKNRNAILDIMETMLSSLESIAGFTQSPLFAHMSFQPLREDVLHTLRQDLLVCFRDIESYGFLADDPRYQKLTEQR